MGHDGLGSCEAVPCIGREVDAVSVDRALGEQSGVLVDTQVVRGAKSLPRQPAFLKCLGQMARNPQVVSLRVATGRLEHVEGAGQSEARNDSELEAIIVAVPAISELIEAFHCRLDRQYQLGRRVGIH